MLLCSFWVTKVPWQLEQVSQSKEGFLQRNLRISIFYHILLQQVQKYSIASDIFLRKDEIWKDLFLIFLRYFQDVGKNNNSNNNNNYGSLTKILFFTIDSFSCYQLLPTSIWKFLMTAFKRFFTTIFKYGTFVIYNSYKDACTYSSCMSSGFIHYWFPRGRPS